jgi:hypothetical protein
MCTQTNYEVWRVNYTLYHHYIMWFDIRTCAKVTAKLQHIYNIHVYITKEVLEALYQCLQINYHTPKVLENRDINNHVRTYTCMLKIIAVKSYKHFYMATTTELRQLMVRLPICSVLFLIYFR